MHVCKILQLFQKTDMKFEDVFRAWLWGVLLFTGGQASGQYPTFAAPVDIAAGSVQGISALDVGDFNQDGYPDVALMEGGAHAGGRFTLAWFEQQPGRPWIRHDFVAGITFDDFIGSARCADMDGDGDLDLVLTNDGHTTGPIRVYLLENPGKAHCTDPWPIHLIATIEGVHANDMQVADMDADGKLDVVIRHKVPDAVQILFQDSKSTWQVKMAHTGQAGEGLAVGDIDQDGLPDISITGHWLKSPADARQGNYQRYDIEAGYKAINKGTKDALGDLNGDGRLDLVLSPAEAFPAYGGANYDLAWYEGPTDPLQSKAWKKHLIRADYNHGHCLKLADMDQDGDLDILSARAWEARDIRIFWNEQGDFSNSTQVTAGKGIYSGAVADMDGDGDLDIVGEDQYAHDARPWWYENRGMSKTSYPSIFLVRDKTAGFTSVEELKHSSRNGHREVLWQDFLRQAEADLKIPYLDPTVDFPGRSPVHLRHANVSYDMAQGVSERIFRAALLFVLTEDGRYKDLVMRQIEALYDTELWPMWCDQAHVRHGAPYVDIRTCRISMWVALAYNWLHDHLSEQERAYIIKGLDERAIQPFWEKLAQRPSWYTHRHNWFTNIFGGMAITAMALGDDHPDSRRLLDTIVPEMIAFNDTFGPEGEFNEPPGYAGAIRFSVEFAEAYRYYTGNRRNLLEEKPFPEVCYWVLYHTLPTGRLTAFGDSPVDKAFPSPEVMAAVANANRDSILQWYYLHYFSGIQSPFELIWYNPAVQPVSPEGKLPLGKAYQGHGAGLISRSAWLPDSSVITVYGKAGRETNHDDNDVGQLLIDGFGERLIIDPGSPKPIYPADYFGANQYQYYTRSSQGHNVLRIGKQEMISEPNEAARGSIVHRAFDDGVGASWEIDLSPVYGNADKVTRRVAHLLPGIVLVYDRAELPVADSISLRWHTISPPLLSRKGDFTAGAGQAVISGKVLNLQPEALLQFSSGRHAFQPPFHLSRQGDPLEQHYEPYLQVDTYGRSCSILTLFAIDRKSKKPPVWKTTRSGWKIRLQGKTYTISQRGDAFVLASPDGKQLLLE